MLQEGMNSAAELNVSAAKIRTKTLPDAIATWCRTINGRLALQNGLRALCQVIGCDIAALTRYRLGAKQCEQSIIVDLCNPLNGDRPMRKAKAQHLLGDYQYCCMPGTTWFSSMFETGELPVIDDFQARRNLHEMIAIPLRVSDAVIDVLELHFHRPNDTERLNNLNQIIPILVGTWSERSVGLFEGSASIASLDKSDSGADPDVTILDINNAAGLTRIEYRCCTLLSKGYSLNVIEDEMNISKATARTHLRHIFAKTNCSSLAELTYRLVNEKTNQANNLRLLGGVS